MKKLFLMMGVVFGALALTNCTNDIDESIAPETATKEFALTVSAGDQTRTTIEDFTTSWAAGDQINLFYGWTRNDSDNKHYDYLYASANNFTITAANLASKTFTGKVPSDFDETAAYSFYAVYPYNANLTTPNNGSTTIIVGQTTQTQVGHNNTAHLCGANAPLIGKTEATNTPAITMNHLAAIMELNVTNASTEEFTIKSIKVEAEQKIAGEFVVNFGRDVVVYGDTANSTNSATLTVNEGTKMAANEVAKFYISVKPFTAKAGETMKFTITTDKGDIVMDKVLVNDLSLNAGKIKKVALKANRTVGVYNKEVAAAGSSAIYADMDTLHAHWYLKAKEEYDWVTPNKWESQQADPFRENITFTAKANNSGIERTAYYYVVDVNGVYHYDIIIKQAATYVLNPSDIEFLAALVSEGHLKHEDGTRYQLHADLQPENFGTTGFDGWLPGAGITISNKTLAGELIGDGSVYYITSLSAPSSRNIDVDGVSVSKKVVINSFPQKMHLPHLERFDYNGVSSLNGKELPQDWNTPELTFVRLSWNRMTGTIPAGLAASPKLAEVYANQNDFYGALPHYWASDKLEVLLFEGGNTGLGYMIPASFNVVLPDQRVAQGDKVQLKFTPGYYNNWKGFEIGWGQNRYVKFGEGAEDDLTTWSNHRMPNYDAANTGNEAWYNMDGWLPHTLNEWSQAEADAYTAQCKADRGL